MVKQKFKNFSTQNMRLKYEDAKIEEKEKVQELLAETYNIM